MSQLVSSDSSSLSASLNEKETSSPQLSPRFGFIRRYASSVAVIGLLGLAAYWGHSMDWKIPKFSELVGKQTAESERWCDEHGVPEAIDIECNPKLHPPMKDYGWCVHHGVSQCPFENADIIQLADSVSFTSDDRNRSALALALRARQENNSLCKSHLRRVQFASHEAAEKAGVDVAVVDRSPVVEAIVANGEVQYDQTRMARLSSRAAGAVWSVRKNIGDAVRAGEVLALIDSAEVGRTKAEFLQALSHERLTSTNLRQLLPLADQQAIAGRQLREANSAHQEAEIRLQGARQSLVNLGFAVPAKSFDDVSIDDAASRLQFLGIPAEIAASLDRSNSTTSLFPLRASLDGIVVERNIVEGEVVDTNKPLFAIADVTNLWLVLDVRQDDIEFVKYGASVRFRASDRTSGSLMTGTIAWLSTEADERTRTVKVRAELPNDGSLRSNTFGTGQIILRDEKESIGVPAEAIHWDGCCHIVFVRDRDYFKDGSPKFYHVRKVRLGVKEGTRTEVLAGLSPGEVIAAKGSSILAAQLLRSNLGEGCGCVH